MRAWLEKQAQPQADGTYLVRHGRGVYEIDAFTKRRWIDFRIAAAWLAVAPAMLFFVILAFGRFATAVLFSSAAMLAFALLYYGAALLILRRSERVPEERWKGPRIVDHRALLLRRGERVSLVPAALLALLCLLAVFSGRPGAVTDMLPVILLLAAYVGFALLQ